MLSLSSRQKLGLIFGGEILTALGVYIWCYSHGACSGPCISVGYIVGNLCLALALKILVALIISTLIGHYLTRKR